MQPFVVTFARSAARRRADSTASCCRLRSRTTLRNATSPALSLTGPVDNDDARLAVGNALVRRPVNGLAAG